MAGAGADEPTSATFRDTFGFPDRPAIDEAMNALLSDITVDDETGVVEVADSVWLQQGFDVSDEYLDSLARFYGAAAYETDIAGDTETARAAINEWVSDRTRELIPEVVQEDGLDSATKVVLINTMYLKQSCASQFGDAEPGPFTVEDGSKITVPTLSDSTMRGAIGAGKGWEAAELPYENPDYSMVLVKPKDLERFVQRVDQRQWNEITGSLEKGSFELSMPKWETETAIDLASPLTAMGVPIPGGSFPGIGPGLTIGAVAHGAKITVDENGTEAAAATVVGMPTSAVEPDGKIAFDHPFFYAVTHKPTGLILFAGTIADPSQA